MKLNYNDIQFIITESIDRLINENKGFNSFPKYGYCLIMAGGPGSGKSTLIKERLPIDGKIFSVDDLTEKFASLPYIKKKDIKHNDMKKKLRKSEEVFLSAQGDIKNNIIFDICGSPKGRGGTWSEIEEIVSMVKPLGYKIGIIWVATNRSVQIKRNLSRKRTVSDATLHDKTNGVNKFLPMFLTSKRSMDIDDAWIVFSSGANLHDNNIPETIHLEKTENGFNLSDEQKTFLSNFLGPQEKETFKKPITYLANSEVRRLEKEPTDFIRR